MSTSPVSCCWAIAAISFAIAGAGYLAFGQRPFEMGYKALDLLKTDFDALVVGHDGEGVEEELARLRGE